VCKTGSVSIQLKLTLLIGGAPAACVPTFSLIIRRLKVQILSYTVADSNKRD
jgi:hypothetical protein